MIDLDEINLEDLNKAELAHIYQQLMHGVQSGIAMRINDPNYDGATPKHLRVGINSAHITDKALAELLMEKGIITEEEYFRKMVEATIDELKMLEEEVEGSISSEMDLNITLR